MKRYTTGEDVYNIARISKELLLMTKINNSKKNGQKMLIVTSQRKVLRKFAPLHVYSGKCKLKPILNTLWKTENITDY